MRAHASRRHKGEDTKIQERAFFHSHLGVHTQRKCTTRKCLPCSTISSSSIRARTIPHETLETAREAVTYLGKIQGHPLVRGSGHTKKSKNEQNIPRVAFR